MLSDKEKQFLRERLTADRTRLLENAAKAMDFSMDRDRDRIGRDSLDESVEEWMYATALRLHDREKFLLGKINSALERLDADEIDECEECEEPIGFKRLQARPVTTLCIVCKEDRESTEGA